MLARCDVYPRRHQNGPSPHFSVQTIYQAVAISGPGRTTRPSLSPGTARNYRGALKRRRHKERHSYDRYSVQWRGGEVLEVDGGGLSPTPSSNDCVRIGTRL